MGFMDRWRLARRLQRQAADGCVLVAVPSWMAAEVSVLIWNRRVERAKDRWARKTAEVPLSKWQSAMLARDDQRPGA